MAQLCDKKFLLLHGDPFAQVEWTQTESVLGCQIANRLLSFIEIKLEPIAENKLTKRCK